MAVVLWVIFDFVLTTCIAVVAARWATAKYLDSRTDNHLGKKDVAVFRRMRDILIAIKTVDDLTGDTFGVPASLRADIEVVLEDYANNKELPS